MFRSSSGSRPIKLVLATAGAVSASALVLAGCSSNASDAAGEVTPEGQVSASQSASGSASASASASAKAKESASAKASESASATASPSASASASANTKKPSSSYNMSGSKATAKPSAKPAKKPSYTINPRITVSKSKGLKNGEYVTVSGTGFDNTKGIYVALCVITGGKPTPCGGGADTDGGSNKSEWISSNPPTYGQALAKPYGPNGSFTVRVKVSEKIGSFDCTSGGCAIFTKADHTRASDRSLDRYVRISFA